MVALRTRALRFWLATVGLLSIAVLYVAPTVEAIIAARPARTLPAISVPVTWFPRLAPPKLHAAPAIPHIKPAANTSTPTLGKARKHIRQTVPVARESYTFAPSSSQSPSTPKPGTYAASPVLTALAGAIANAPVTTDQSGTPEAITTTTQVAPTTDTGVGTDPAALAPGSTTPPAPVTDATAATSTPTATTAATTDPAPASTPTPHNDTSGSPPPPSSTDPAPTVPAPTTTDPAPTTTDPAPTTDTQITSSTPPEISSGSVVPPPTTPAPTDPVAGDPATGTPPVTSTPTPVTLPTAWQVSAGGETVSVSVSGTDLVVSVGGTSTSKPLADVSELDVTGPGALALDATTAIGVPISYDASSAGSVSVTGGSGSTWSYDSGSGSVSGGGVTLSFRNVTTLAAGAGRDELDGPAADSVWRVTGNGTGTVGGVAFSGFDRLVGAANNKDQFVFEPTGSITAGIDGGAGGFDTLVLDGGQSRNITYTSLDPHSGSVSRDGSVISYTGLEPVVNTGTSANQQYAGTSGNDHIVIADDAGANDGGFTISSDTSESIQITNADQIQSLTIDASTGDDSLRYDTIDSKFAGTIYFHGGTGSNSLIAGNATGGAWEISAVDAGSYTPTGGPHITFDGVGSLQGGTATTRTASISTAA